VTLHPKATFGTALPDGSSFQTSEPELAFANDLLTLRPALQAFARRLTRQACDAEDLVQDTILRALRSRHLFAEGTNLKSWLFTIMRNAFITRSRRASREVTTEAEAINFMAITPATQETLLWAQQVAGLLLHHLSPTHRDVLILISVQGLSYEDVAQMSGCAVGTVKSRVSRARAALAALLDDPSDKTEQDGGDGPLI
jgi:RNA polymerase sigma-70 factor, ECF subfamily